LKPDSIVLFSTADWDNPFWTNKQHMAFHLSARGYKVLYIESLGLRKMTVTGGDWRRVFRRIKKFFSGPRQRGERLWVFSPILLPLHHIRWVQKLNHYVLTAQLRFFMWRLGFKNSIAWTYNPLVLDLIHGLGLTNIVYHCVDDLGAAPRLPKEQIEIEEARLVRKADVVFVTSTMLEEKLRGRGPGLLRYYPNVADFAHFQRARDPELAIPVDLLEIRSPRIGFVGAISSYKLDFDLIAEAAAMRPDWNWVLIGKVGEGDPHTDASALNKPNIHLMGPKSYAELPAYLKGMDAVILPCSLNEYTKSMFPMKFFEYLAAGKVVVATDLPSLKPYREIFTMAEGPSGFNQALDKILSGEIKYTPKMDEMARENTWESRLDRMLADLDAALVKRD
jgi:glycosyltransferase involved in cell wall biosynthesis